MSYEQFKEFYDKRGYLPNDIARRKNLLNTNQLESRYKKYVDSLEKQGLRKERLSLPDERWEELKILKDLSRCQLFDRLMEFDMKSASDSLLENATFLFKTIDPAHVFRKSTYPRLKYEPLNVVPLNRYSHSMIDSNKCPITGKPITAEEVEQWWGFILGEEDFRKLKEMTND